MLTVMLHFYAWITSSSPKFTLSEPPASQQNQFSWQPSGEMHAAIAGQQIAVMESRNHSKDNEDVEVMSTDSSSSSSSDSQ